MPGRLPDFLIIGAPKAGTTALHAALAQHPDVYTTTPKEPKYWLCDDAPPPAWRGPGDKHSQQEWMWRRRDYEALFERAPGDVITGESTPFYLWSHGAQRRIAAGLPDARLIAVVRDPVDRAYSNWMHLWSDGLERVGDFETALGLEAERIDAGYAPFWRYAQLGRYGAQLAHLLELVERDRVLVMRYRELVDDPAAAVDRACRFLGIAEGQVQEIPRDNSRDFVEPGWRPRVVGPIIRAGARLGQFGPPEIWRRLSPPLVRQLRGRGEVHRPRLEPHTRARLVRLWADDIAQLSAVTGEDFGDWLSPTSRGSFAERARQRA